MQVEIDQSWKIEDTNKDSVVAFSNHTASSVRIFAQDKQKLQQFFRDAGKAEMFIYRTFAILIFFISSKITLAR